MALKVQTHAGETVGANSYASLVAMKAYHADRLVDLSPYNDTQLEAALIRATDFMDGRYSFVGSRLKALQGTQCPRFVPNSSGVRYLHDAHTLEPAYLLSTAQWEALEKACVRLARRALLSPDLMPDPTFDATGQKVSKRTVKAGPVETTVEYAQSASPRFDSSVPSFPEVDMLLRTNGLLVSRVGGTIGRA